MIEVGQKFPGSGAKALLVARPTMMRIQLIDAALWHFQAAVIAAGVALPEHPMLGLRN
jgi:hypothetical protein